MKQSFESPQSIPETFSTPQEELEYLRSKVEKLEQTSKSSSDKKEDTESLIKKTLEEYDVVEPQSALAPKMQLSNQEAGEIVLALRPEEHDARMAELVHVLETKGVKNAVDIVSSLEDPHIIDDFHRFLVAYIKAGYNVTGIREGDPLYKSLHRVLFEVAIPDNVRDESKQSLSEIVATMQQMYSGILSISSSASKNEYMTMEIAKPVGESNFIFYISIPDSKVELFKKQILSFFSEIILKEQVDDFNIFARQSQYAIGYLTQKYVPVKTLKTIDDFETDPLKSILNVFSRLDDDADGAALQFVFKPAGDFYDKSYTKGLKKMQDGETFVPELSLKNTGLSKLQKSLSSFSREAGKFTQSAASSKDKDETTDAAKKDKVDSVLLQNLEEKVAHPTVSTNIRIISATETIAKSEAVLEDIASAFNQFNKPTGNTLVLEKVPERKKKQAITQFSFRQFDKSFDTPLNLKEIATLFHFPSRTEVKNPNLKIEKSKSAPVSRSVNHGEGVLLGKNTHAGTDTQIFMNPEDRLRHMYIIGQTGTGKSMFLQNMIIQDIKNGDGVCFIDPHGSDVQDILANIPQERLEDVIYFDPSYTKRPMGLNMLEYNKDYPEQKTFVVNELFSIFQKLYGGNPESMGPMFEQYFRNATMLVIEDPATGNTLLDVSRVMTDKVYRDLKIMRCKNPVVVDFWKSIAGKAGGDASLENIVPYITSKFDVFLANDIMRPVIAQEHSSFNFRDVMDNKKILLVNLSKGRLGDINAHLLGLIIVGKILMAALSRVDTPKNELNPFYFYIDEFQNVTTDSISAILSEARKYKLGLTMAHQFIAQIDDGIKDAVFGNVGTISTFRIGSDDAKYLENQFAPLFTAGDIMNIPNYNCYMKMLVHGVPTDPFNMATYPAPEGRPSIVEDMKQLSYQVYGKDREEVEATIAKKYRK